MELAFGIPGLIQVTAHIVKTIICITSTASTTSALAIRLRATFTGLHHILNQLETHYDVEAQQRMAVHVADVLEVIQAVEGKIEKWTEKSEEDGGGGHGGSSSKTKWSTGAARKTGEKAKAFVRWLKGEKEEVEGLLEELALRRDVLGMAMSMETHRLQRKVGESIAELAKSTNLAVELSYNSQEAHLSAITSLQKTVTDLQTSLSSRAQRVQLIVHFRTITPAPRLRPNPRPRTRHSDANRRPRAARKSQPMQRISELSNPKPTYKKPHIGLGAHPGFMLLKLLTSFSHDKTAKLLSIHKCIKNFAIELLQDDEKYMQKLAGPIEQRTRNRDRSAQIYLQLEYGYEVNSLRNIRENFEWGTLSEWVTWSVVFALGPFLTFTALAMILGESSSILMAVNAVAMVQAGVPD